MKKEKKKNEKRRKKKNEKKILPSCSNPAISIFIPMLSVLLIIIFTPLPHEMKIM